MKIVNKRTISRKDLAETACVSMPAVTKACKGSLIDACIGNKLDLDHPFVQAYIKKGNERKIKKSQKQVKVAPKPKPKKVEKITEVDPEEIINNILQTEEIDISPDEQQQKLIDNLKSLQESLPEVDKIDLDLLPHMTITEVMFKYGTFEPFKDMVTALKIIEEVKIKKVEAQAKRQTYIPRDLVSQHVFPAVDNAFTKLVEDFPSSITKEVVSMVKAGTKPIEVEQLVRGKISKILKDVKANALRMLKK